MMKGPEDVRVRDDTASLGFTVCSLIGHSACPSRATPGDADSWFEDNVSFSLLSVLLFPPPFPSLPPSFSSFLWNLTAGN